MGTGRCVGALRGWSRHPDQAAQRLHRQEAGGCRTQSSLIRIHHRFHFAGVSERQTIDAVGNARNRLVIAQASKPLSTRWWGKRPGRSRDSRLRRPPETEITSARSCSARESDSVRTFLFRLRVAPPVVRLRLLGRGRGDHQCLEGGFEPRHRDNRCGCGLTAISEGDIDFRCRALKIREVALLQALSRCREHPGMIGSTARSNTKASRWVKVAACI
jgi:hypothetical protein